LLKVNVYREEQVLIVMTMNKGRAEEIKPVLQALHFNVSIDVNGPDDMVDLNVNFEEDRDPTVREAVDAVLAFSRAVPV
jgi:hypothetical protein